MTPKPVSDAVKKGIACLIKHQHKSGGWGQGGGWRSDAQGVRVEAPTGQDLPDVANTCIAALALMRGGHSAQNGAYYPQVLRALGVVIDQVERADTESPYVTDLRGTQVQTKIGPYVDTFLAALALGEAKGCMPHKSTEIRLSAALDKVIRKMERHQQTDGTWAMGGWAPVVGQGLAVAGLSRARQRGARVSDETLNRCGEYARSQYDPATKTFSDIGSAGTPLYATASHLASSSHTLHGFEDQAAHDETLSSAYANFRDPGFIQGFGSNGGEEFISYLNISETLAQKGGKEWEDWNRSMTDNLERIQNKDGSWTGHHCITGRTFCTAAALLVLLADRSPHAESKSSPTAEPAKA